MNYFLYICLQNLTIKSVTFRGNFFYIIYNKHNIMKKSILLIISLCFTLMSQATQILVDTNSVYKNVVIEEFTGVDCAGSPSGDSVITAIVTAHPDRVFPVCIHWGDYGWSTPLCVGDPDFSRVRPTGFSPESPAFIPLAALNREKFGEASYFWMPQAWSYYVDSLLKQPAKLNIGFSSSYNSTSHELTVDIQVYMKEDLSTQGLLLVTALTEDNLVACQKKGISETIIPGYIHNHVLRELPTDVDDFSFWYESIISGAQTKGFMYSTQIVFNNSRTFVQGDMTSYNMANCNLVVYVRDYAGKFVYNALGLKVGESSAVGIQEVKNTNDCRMYPNPATNNITIENLDGKAETIAIYNLMGSCVLQEQLQNNSNTIDISSMPTGVYMVRLSGVAGTTQHKLIKK